MPEGYVAKSVTTRVHWGLDSATRQLEEARWGFLLALASLATATGVVTALVGAYAVAFVAVTGGLCAAACRSGRAACVAMGLAAPVVAVGSVDAGFHLLPAYPVLVAGLLGELVRGGWRRIQLGAPDVCLLGFCLLAFAATVGNLGLVPNATVVGATGANAPELRTFAQLAATLGMVALYFMVRMGVRNEESLGAVLRALCTASMFVVAYALYQLLGRELGFPYTFVNERRPISSLPAGVEYIRVNSTLPEASPLAQFLLIGTCLGIAWLIGRRPAWVSRRLAVIVTVAYGTIVLATLSKAAWLAFALWLPAMVVLVRGMRLRGSRDRWRFAAAVVAAAVLVVGLIGPLRAGSVGRSYSGNVSLSEVLKSERLLRMGYWLAAARIIEEHPLGVGIGNYAFHYPRNAPLSFDFEFQPGIADAHNLFLEVAVEGGVLAGLLFAGFIVLLLVRALRRGRDDPTAAALAVAAGVGATMHVTYSYFYYPFEWVLLGLIGAFAVIPHTPPKRPGR